MHSIDNLKFCPSDLKVKMFSSPGTNLSHVSEVSSENKTRNLNPQLPQPRTMTSHTIMPTLKPRIATKNRPILGLKFQAYVEKTAAAIIGKLGDLLTRAHQIFLQEVPGSSPLIKVARNYHHLAMKHVIALSAKHCRYL